MLCLSCSFGFDYDWRVLFVVLGVFYHSVDVEAHGDIYPDYCRDHHVSSLFEITHASYTFQVGLYAKYDSYGCHYNHEGGDKEVDDDFAGGKSESEPT